MSEFLYSPTEPHTVQLPQRVFTELYIHSVNSVCFILYMKQHEEERRECAVFVMSTGVMVVFFLFFYLSLCEVYVMLYQTN